MKFSNLFNALGCGAQVLNSASAVAVIVGAVYLIDCRTSATGQDAIDKCYLSALPMMGIGVAGRGGFNIGFNTYNPALRPEDQTPERDEKNRFRK